MGAKMPSCPHARDRLPVPVPACGPGSVPGQLTRRGVKVSPVSGSTFSGPLTSITSL